MVGVVRERWWATESGEGRGRGGRKKRVGTEKSKGVLAMGNGCFVLTSSSNLSRRHMSHLSSATVNTTIHLLVARFIEN